MRLRNKWFTSLIFLISTFTYAGDMGEQPISNCCSREGLYFGAGVGDSFNRFNFRVFNTVTGFEEIFYPRRDRVMATVFGGYASTAKNGFYLAGEVGTDFPKRKARVIRQGVQLTSTEFVDHLSVQDYVTADILPGYRINQRFLAYGRIGAAYSHLKFTQDATFTAPRFLNSYTIPSTRLGAGVNVGVTPQISVGVDYIYMGYQPLNALFSNGFTILFNSLVRTNYVGVSAMYNFC